MRMECKVVDGETRDSRGSTTKKSHRSVALKSSSNSSSTYLFATTATLDELRAGHG